MNRYSIDKIKLYIHGVKCKEVYNPIQNLMDTLSINPNVKSYESKDIKSCRYNYIIREEDTKIFGKIIKGNSFYLGIEPNWSKDKNKNFKDIVIEYNPNKINLKGFPYLLDIMRIDEGKIEILSMDMAYDFYDYEITDLIMYQRHGNEYWAKLGHGTMETYYLGTFGTNGHVKLYNKAKEQKIADMKWVRFEITYKKLGFLDMKDEQVIRDTKLPMLKIIDKSKDLEGLGATEKYIFLTSLENMELLSMLDKRMKKKILTYHKELLKNVEINLEEIVKVYRYYKFI